MDIKQDLYTRCLQDTHLDLKTHTKWKWTDGKRYSMQMEMKESRDCIFMLDKIHFKTKNVTREEEYYIMISGSIQQEDIILVNIYAFNIEAPTNPCEFKYKMSLKDRHITCFTCLLSNSFWICIVLFKILNWCVLMAKSGSLKSEKSNKRLHSKNHTYC